MPIACLALAALVAFGGRGALTTLVLLRHKLVLPAVAAAALVLLAVDLRVPVFGAVAADEPRAAPTRRFAATVVCSSSRCSGRTSTSAARTSGTPARARVSGRRATRPSLRAAARRLARELRGLSCGRGAVPPSLGIRFVAVHRGLYDASGFFAPSVPSARRPLCVQPAGACSPATGPIATCSTEAERGPPARRPLPAHFPDEATKSVREAWFVADLPPTIRRTVASISRWERPSRASRSTAARRWSSSRAAVERSMSRTPSCRSRAGPATVADISSPRAGPGIGSASAFGDVDQR